MQCNAMQCQVLHVLGESFSGCCGGGGAGDGGGGGVGGLLSACKVDVQNRESERSSEKITS